MRRYGGAVPTVTAHGVEIHYERAGSGPALLFCMGSGESIDGSRLLIDLLTKTFDVVVVDPRGLGRTSLPDRAVTMADYVADLLAVLDAEGLEHVRVMGMSFGGMLAQELAVDAPDRVARLALLCTSAGGAGGSSYPLDELADLPLAEQQRIGIGILDSRFTPEWLADHPQDRGLVDMVAARREAPVDDATRVGRAAQLAARRGHDVYERLTAITAPTLVAAGRYDGIAPVANSKRIAGRIPGADVRVYEGGHIFFVQDPTAFPEITAFLTAA